MRVEYKETDTFITVYLKIYAICEKKWRGGYLRGIKYIKYHNTGWS